MLVVHLLRLFWVFQSPNECAVLTVMKDATTEFRSDDEEVIDGVLVWLITGVAAERDIDGALIKSYTESAYNLPLLVWHGRGKKSRDREKMEAAYEIAAELLEVHAAILDALCARIMRRESTEECVPFLGESFDQTSTTSSGSFYTQ